MRQVLPGIGHESATPERLAGFRVILFDRSACGCAVAGRALAARRRRVEAGWRPRRHSDRHSARSRFEMSVSNLLTLDHSASPGISSPSRSRSHNSRTRATKDLRSRTESSAWGRHRARCEITRRRVLAANSPTGCSAKSPDRGRRLRARRGGPVRGHPREVISRPALRRPPHVARFFWIVPAASRPCLQRAPVREACRCATSTGRCIDCG
jgi:hypothetical protein